MIISAKCESLFWAADALLIVMYLQLDLMVQKIFIELSLNLKVTNIDCIC